jgi:hypothetical protein
MNADKRGSEKPFKEVFDPLKEISDPLKEISDPRFSAFICG